MTRFTSFAILIALTGSVHAQAPAEPSAEPQTQAQIAEQLNTEGRELMYDNKAAEAAEKFRQAIARDAEAKYFLNLCTAQLTAGKLGEALTACNNVEQNRPSAEQTEKAKKLIARINDEAKAQNLPLVAEGGGASGDTGHVVGRPLGTNLVVAGPPDNRYTWTLGVDLFGGGGRVGRADYYGSAIAGARVKGDYLIDPVHRIGAEAYFQISHLGPGKNDSLLATTLDIFDIGIAGYKHFCPGGTPRLCITPLVGAHLSLMSPQGEMDDTGSQVFNYAGVGGRAEVSMALAFGRRFEHVLSIMVGANVYSAVLAGPSADSGSLTIAEAGLDQGGGAVFAGVGYTYRFNTPLGSTPFIVLE